MWLLYAILIMIGAACFNNLVWISIQADQLFGAWQNVLRKWDMDGNTVPFKMLGGCETCTFHLLSLVEFILCACLLPSPVYGWYWILAYLVFVPITSILSLLIFKARTT